MSNRAQNNNIYLDRARALVQRPELELKTCDLTAFNQNLE